MPVALHDELADLRSEVGPQVFDDPVAFRAAFDDFIPEGSATTGEVSLLVGAIATGALQRLQEQLAIGADPEISINVQADLLARDRGTSESSGARWALSVLAHAIGALPAEGVPTRPVPGPDSVGTADRPTRSAATEVVDPGPTGRIEATRVVSEEPPPSTSAPAPSPPEPVVPDRRRSSPLLVAAVAVLAVIAVVAVALLVLRDEDSPDDAANDRSSEPVDSEPSADEEVLAQTDLEAEGTTVRLQMVRNGTDVEIVLLADEDGEYVEVDRQPAPCPYLDASFDAGIENEGGNEYFYGWQNRDNEGFGGYGQVQPDEGVLIVYEIDGRCPTER